MGSRILSRSFTVENWDSADDDEEEEEFNEMDVDSSPSRGQQDQNAQREAKDGEEKFHDEVAEEDEDEEDPSDVAMVPMADILNARYGSENAKLFYEKHTLRMVSTKPISAGEQIWNTYGDPPNSDLLRRYGHVDQVPLPQGDVGNPADIVEIRADLVVSTANSQADQERIDWWLEEGGDDTFILDNDFDLPETMISLIKLVQLPSADWEKAKQKGKPPKPKVDAGVLAVIVDVLKKRLAQYGTSVQEDTELLSTRTDLTDNHKNAVVVRLGEKRILSIVLEQQQQQLQAMQSHVTDVKRKRGAESSTCSTHTAKKGKR